MKKSKNYLVVFQNKYDETLHNEEFHGKSKEEVYNFIKDRPYLIGKLNDDIVITNIIEL